MISLVIKIWHLEYSNRKRYIFGNFHDLIFAFTLQSIPYAEITFGIVCYKKLFKPQKLTVANKKYLNVFPIFPNFVAHEKIPDTR